MVLDLEVQERKIYFEYSVSLLLCLLNSFRSILSFKTNASYLYIHWMQTYQIQYVIIRGGFPAALLTFRHCDHTSA